MISKNIYLFLGVFLFNLLTANISSIESKFFHSVAFALNDTIMDTGGESIHNQPEYNYKSPAKAMFYSGILPGLGQGYLRSWKRTILFAGIEAIALGTWYHYNSMGKEHEGKYKAFANENWSFTRWIKYYYKWNE